MGWGPFCDGAGTGPGLPSRAPASWASRCLLHAVAWHRRGRLSNPRPPPGSGFRCKHSCPQGDRLGPAGAWVWGEGLGAGSLLWRRQGRPAALSPDFLSGPSLLALPRPGPALPLLQGGTSLGISTNEILQGGGLSQSLSLLQLWAAPSEPLTTHPPPTTPSPLASPRKCPGTPRPTEVSGVIFASPRGASLNPDLVGMAQALVEGERCVTQDIRAGPVTCLAVGPFPRAPTWFQGWSGSVGICPVCPESGSCPGLRPHLVRRLRDLVSWQWPGGASRPCLSSHAFSLPPQPCAAPASALTAATACPAQPSRAAVPLASRVLAVSMVSGAPSRYSMPGSL